MLIFQHFLRARPSDVRQQLRGVHDTGSGIISAEATCREDRRLPAERPARPMSHSVQRHLRVTVSEYDAAIRRFIPGYDEMLARAAAAVAAVRPAHVLDLGAGTGALSEALLRHREVGMVELVDVDEDMLAQARARLQGHGERARFTHRSFDQPFPHCNAMAAALSLHHIGALAEKAALFERAFAALAPGGVLVNADACMPADEAERDGLYRVWADHMVSAGIPEDRAWQHFEEWAAEDTYLPLDDELAALRGAGFAARCIWTNGPMGVVVATREG